MLSGMNLSEWNRAQIKLWTKLEQEGLVQHNNLEHWNIFSKIFHDYVEWYAIFPPYELMKEFIRENIRWNNK